jgi:hypothetical protein
MNIPDLIFENLAIFDADADPEFGIRNLVSPGSGIRDEKSRIRDKHPGSAIQVKQI